MITEIFNNIILPSFFYCERWFSKLVSSLGVGPLLLATFSLVFVIGVLFMPLRGYGFARGGSFLFSPRYQARTLSRKVSSAASMGKFF